MKRQDRFFFCCGLILLASEIWKQWTLTFQLNHGVYNFWYFPFQLCSVPMYVCLILPWVPDPALGKIRETLSGAPCLSHGLLPPGRDLRLLRHQRHALPVCASHRPLLRLALRPDRHRSCRRICPKKNTGQEPLPGSCPVLSCLLPDRHRPESLLLPVRLHQYVLHQPPLPHDPEVLLPACQGHWRSGRHRLLYRRQPPGRLSHSPPGDNYFNLTIVSLIT